MNSKIIEKIKFNSPDDARRFVELMDSNFECDVDISTDPNDNRSYDAKSLVGVWALDLSKELYVSIVTDDRAVVNEFKAIVRQWQEEN
ncbi:MAG: hypothetical protein LUH21_04825 [Clostridiales bacterium]|nr:hypothetical protein [Clostridiales bacterium]